MPDLAMLIDAFLPIDQEAIESALETAAQIDVIAASLGSFSVAAPFTLARLDGHGREQFCRQLAAESEGLIQPWMVEATLRSVEGDRDALAGTDPTVISSIHMLGLYLISDQYLTSPECEALRLRAAQQALEYRSQLATLPH